MNHAGGFFEMWNPILLLLLIVIGYVYWNLVGPEQRIFKDAEPVERNKKLLFYTGLSLFYIAQGSIVNYIGHHYLFSVHMLQQTILYLMVPILIWRGLPAWLLRPFLYKGFFGKIFTFLTRPLIAIFTFNMVFSIYHMPFIMNGLMQNEWLLFGYHLILQITAFTMWFPIFCPLPEKDKLSDMQKIGYIFANGVLLTPACALIIFAKTLLYDMYSYSNVPFAHLPALDDQQLGGVIMKIIQEIVYGAVLAHIFFRWYRRERQDDKDDYPQGYEPQQG
ncbi:cytochrome c oxidase assembly protein [Paenibacillus eucommiae]|nr:cytochrome c oxidase assembly protein [Paenibacillus eucommiae]